jgi:hypothetical protein
MDRFHKLPPHERQKDSSQHTRQEDPSQSSSSETSAQREQSYMRFLSTVPDAPQAASSGEQTHSDAKESSSHDIQLIESISNRDIDDLQNTVKKICDKHIQKHNNLPKKQKPYIDAKSRYESAFQSIREGLKGETLDKRIETIQGYLNDKNDDIKFLTKKLLNDKQNAQSDLKSINQQDSYQEAHQAGEPSGSHRQTEVPSYVPIQGKYHYDPPDVSFRVARQSILSPEEKIEPGIHLTHLQAPDLEVHIPMAVINLNATYYNHLNQIKTTLNSYVTSITSADTISNVFAEIRRGRSRKTMGTWTVRFLE